MGSSSGSISTSHKNKSHKKWIAWVITGAVLSAGIVLIALGSSYLVQYKDRPEDSEGIKSYTMDISFDSTYLRVSNWNQLHVQPVKSYCIYSSQLNQRKQKLTKFKEYFDRAQSI